MKKLFLGLMTLLMFSCSNDELSTVVPDSATYPVNVAVSGFTLEARPLSRATMQLPANSQYDTIAFVKYFFYKDDQIVIQKLITEFDSDLNNLKITEELPVGTYRLAVIKGWTVRAAYEAVPHLTALDAVNFSTDHCTGVYRTGRSDLVNANFYYESKLISVNKDVQNDVSLELEPMWSKVSINIKDLASCKFPQGANYVTVKMSSGVGFYLKDKFSHLTEFGIKNTYSLADVKAGKLLTANIEMNSFENGEVELEFDDVNQTTMSLFKGVIEHGCNITLSGNIGNLAQNKGDNIGFSFEQVSFKDKEIEF